MELPIQTMIVLFISILVASSIIYFSTDIITDAKSKMADPWEKDVPENQIVQVAEITDSGVMILLKECYEANKQEAVSRTLCYVLNGDNTATISSNNYEGIDVETSFTSADRSLYIYYNPAGNKIEITN